MADCLQLSHILSEFDKCDDAEIETFQITMRKTIAFVAIYFNRLETIGVLNVFDCNNEPGSDPSEVAVEVRTDALTSDLLLEARPRPRVQPHFRKGANKAAERSFRGISGAEALIVTKRALTT